MGKIGTKKIWYHRLILYVDIKRDPAVNPRFQDASLIGTAIIGGITRFAAQFIDLNLPRRVQIEHDKIGSCTDLDLTRIQSHQFGWVYCHLSQQFKQSNLSVMINL